MLPYFTKIQNLHICPSHFISTNIKNLLIWTFNNFVWFMMYKFKKPNQHKGFSSTYPQSISHYRKYRFPFFVLCRYFVHSFWVSGCSSLLENVSLCWLGCVDLPIVNQTKSMVLQLQLAFLTVEPEMSKIWSLAKQDLWWLMYVIFCWPFSS